MRIAWIAAILLIAVLFTFTACASPTSSPTKPPSTTPVPTAASTKEVIATKKISVSHIGMASTPWVINGQYYYWQITEVVQPTKSTVPNYRYRALLYEKGEPRVGVFISWSQVELNVLQEKTVNFPATQEEFNAYSGKNISNIFTVQITK